MSAKVYNFPLKFLRTEFVRRGVLSVSIYEIYRRLHKRQQSQHFITRHIIINQHKVLGYLLT